ncbi:hypothetical protein, partial [Bacillus cereus group sp. BfR-BA-01310]
DDEANPHLHINYVPNFESSRGLTRRVGMDRALQQQGIEGKGTELIANWRALETAYIEDLAKEQIPNFERANVGSHKYMKVRQYKEYADAASTMEKLMHKNKNLMAAGTKRLKELVVDLEDSQQEVKQFNERKVTLHDELNKVERRLEEIKNSEIEIPKVEIKKTMFSNDVKVDSVEFERQQEVIKRVAQLPIVIKDKEKELERKNREINSLKDSLSKEQFRNKELVGNNQDLKKENLELKKENKKITDETVRLILVIEMARKHIAKFVDKVAKFMGREFNYSPADEIIDKAEKEVKEILKEQSKPKRREREDELER